jgi:F-type H+-transporting ATPase subunit gamma
VSGRQYILALSEIVACLARLNEKLIKHPFFEKREIRYRGILVIGTEKGLCGSLNQGLVKKIATDYTTGNEKFVTIGKKATQFISKLHRNLLADFSVSDRVELCELRPVIEFLKGAYLGGGVDSVEVVYSRSVNPLVHEQVSNRVLPMLNLTEEINSLKRRMKVSEEGVVIDPKEMIFEPNVQAIVDKLSQMFLSQSILRNVLEAKATEHSARMFAMKNATDNANSLSKNLAMEYNKARQTKITNEIIEIAAATTG